MTQGGKDTRTVDEHDVRLLRRVDLPIGSTGLGSDLVAGFGVVVDVQTTGVDHEDDVVIELAARRFAYDDRHVVTRIDRPYVWREDPERPLSDEISRRTGLTDVDLKDSRIDESEAVRVIGSADIRIAHGAAFDRPFVEGRLPALSGMSWACSIADIGWTDAGYESARLDWLLMKCGFFQDAQRAEADVDAAIRILQHEILPGTTALSTLMANADADSWIVRAFGAAFAVKDVLKGHGYRWNPLQRVWWKEVRDPEAEKAWLAEHVYGRRYGVGGGPAQFEPVDRFSRYGR